MENEHRATVYSSIARLAVFAFIVIMNFSKVQCQKVSDGIVWLQQGQEFYATSIIVDVPNLIKKKFAYGGWKKGIDSDEVWARIESLDYPTNVNLASDGPALLRFSKGPMFGMFPNNTWMFVMWVKDIDNLSVTTELLDLDGNAKLFTSVSNTVVYISSYISMYLVNPNDCYPMFPRIVTTNNLLNSTMFFGPVSDATVLFRSMFYVVSEDEASMHRSISRAMAGVYRGDLRYFKANKFSLSLAAATIKDTTSSTVVNDLARYVTPRGLLVKPRHVVMLDEFMRKDLETVAEELYDGVRTLTVAFILKDSVIRQPGELPLGQTFVVALKSVNPDSGVVSYCNFTLMLDKQKQSMKLRLSSGSDLQPPIHYDRTMAGIVIDPKAAHHTVALTITVSLTKQVDSFFNMLLDLLANVIVNAVVGTYTNDAYTYQRDRVYYGPVVVYFGADTSWSVGVGHMMTNLASSASSSSLNGLEAILDILIVQRGGISLSKDMLGIANADGLLDNCTVKSVGLTYSNGASTAVPYCTLCMPSFLLDPASGQCVKQTSLVSRNLTCKEHLNANDCTQCDLASYYYNSAEQVCHPRSTGCPTSTHVLKVHERTSFDSFPVESCTNRMFLPADLSISPCTYFSALDPSTNVCSCRVSSCSKCLHTECDECSSSYYLVITGKLRSCVPAIPANYGLASAFSSILVAAPCEDRYCNNCLANYRECTQCPPDYLLYDSNSKLCLQCKPSQGRWINGVSCTNCHVECGTCTSSAANTACLTCHPDRILSSPTTPTTCIPCVTTGMFKLDPFTCGPCDSSCLNCTGMSTKCTACTPGLFLFDNYTCGTVCPTTSGFFTGPLNTRCGSCHSTCLTCSGSSPANCTACQSPLALYSDNTTCGTCEVSNGWYIRSSDNSCRKCFPSCKTCSGDEFNQCLTCVDPLVLQPQKSCQYASIDLIDKEFDKYKLSVVFSFSIPIMFSNGTKADDNIEVGVFNNPSISLDDLINSLNTSTTFSSIPSLQQASCTVKNVKISDKTLTVTLQSEKGFENAVVLVRFLNNLSLLSPDNQSYAFTKPAVGIGNVSIVKSTFDDAVQSVAAAATLAITIVTLPQAFILLRLMNSLDLYVFIDLVYPSNFDTVLKMMSSTVMDFIPNVFRPLGSNEGDGLPARFEYFGYNIDFFENVGSTLTIACGLLLLKLATLPLKKYSQAKKSNLVLRLLGKMNVGLDTDFVVSYLEANHVDIILAILVYLTVGEPLAEWSTRRKVIALLLIVSVFALIAVYALLVVKTARVSKLAKASNDSRSLASVDDDPASAVEEHAELNRDLKGESFAFLVLDKQVRGNVFQTYFNVVMLVREAAMCLIVYFMLSMPKVVVALFGVIQLTFTGLMISKNPYHEKRLKYTLITNNVLYLMLNTCLLLLAYLNNSLSSFVQYYIIGFAMIGILFLLILANVGFTLYYTAVGIIQKCKKKPKTNSGLKKKKLLLQPKDNERKTSRLEGSTDPHSKSVNRLIRDGQFSAEDNSGLDIMTSGITDFSTLYNSKNTSSSSSKYRPRARAFRVRDNSTSLSASNAVLHNGLNNPSMSTMQEIGRVPVSRVMLSSSIVKPHTSTSLANPLHSKASETTRLDTNQGGQLGLTEPSPQVYKSSGSNSKRIVSKKRL